MKSLGNETITIEDCRLQNDYSTGYDIIYYYNKSIIDIYTISI